jgi:hypothetical protein
VQFGRFRGVMRGVLVMPVCGVRVVRRRFVIFALVMPRCFAMMTRRVLVVFRCLMMMFRCVFRHSSSHNSGLYPAPLRRTLRPENEGSMNRP